MTNFWRNFSSLLTEKNVSAASVVRECGLTSTGNVSAWKNKDVVPSKKTLKAIADYFGITVEELLADKGNETSISIQTEGQISEEDLLKIQQFAEFVTNRKVSITLENTTQKPLSEVKAKLEALNKAIQDFETADQEEEKTS